MDHDEGYQKDGPSLPIGCMIPQKQQSSFSGQAILGARTIQAHWGTSDRCLSWSCQLDA